MLGGLEMTEDSERTCHIGTICHHGYWIQWPSFISFYGMDLETNEGFNYGIHMLQ